MSELPADLLSLCKDSLRAAGEAEAEVYAQRSTRGAARFAMGELREHMELADAEVLVRVAQGRRLAEAAVSELSFGAVVDAIRRAAETARLLPETSGFPGFAGDEKAGPPPPRFAEGTAQAGAETRARALEPVFAAIRDAGLFAAGILSTTVTESAVATTRGAAREHRGTLASFRVWALATAGAGGASGYGGHMHRDVNALRIDEETERAIRVAKMSDAPSDIELGKYDVVLEPAAVADLLEWLGMIAFAAPEVERGTSALHGRIGERITGERVTIVDDPEDAGEFGFAVPFDREGMPRRKVTLIQGGTASAVLYDRVHAARAGATSTGSAQPARLLSGPVGPSALHMEGGEAESVGELLSGIRRGLYICRLHYVNGLLDTRRAVMTGLSRDGCFLVEHGRIVRPVQNVRFTDSILEALARCDGMTRQRRAIPTHFSQFGSMPAVVAPAVRIREFQVNGKSQ